MKMNASTDRVTCSHTAPTPLAAITVRAFPVIQVTASVAKVSCINQSTCFLEPRRVFESG